MFPINWERVDAGVFTSMLPATRQKSRTFATRETDVDTHRSTLGRGVNAQTKRRQSHVNAGTARQKAKTLERKVDLWPA